MKLFKTLGGTVNAIENMVIDIHNDYTKKIIDLQNDKTNLKKELDEVYHEKSDLDLKLDKALDTIEVLKKELDLSKKANKVLEDRIKELKVNEATKKIIIEYLNDCRELLKKANEVFQENKLLKKETKKNIKGYETANVSNETRKKLK